MNGSLLMIFVHTLAHVHAFVYLSTGELIIAHDICMFFSFPFLIFQSLIKQNTNSSKEYLSNLYPRLKTWYNWFNKTQAGPISHTYR